MERPSHHQAAPEDLFKLLLDLEFKRAERYLYYFLVFRMRLGDLDFRDPALYGAFNLIRKTVRGCDTMGYTQRGELLVIFPETDHSNARKIVRRLNERLQDHFGADLTGLELKVDWFCYPSDGKTPRDFLNSLDHSAY